MSAPEPDNARQELERAATAILSELTAEGRLPSSWTYQQVHSLVAAAYGRGYVAGGTWARDMYERGLDRMLEAVNRLP